MAIPGSLFYRSPALQVICVLCVLAVLVTDAGGRRHHQIQLQPACPTFTCGAHLRNVSYPFRRRGDPPECGVASYELTCTDDKAIIQIDNGTYLVRGINYTDATFSVVDANMLDSSNSTCPLPRWNRIPYKRWYWVVEDSSRNIVQELMPSYSTITAAFVTCSLEVTNNGVYMYMPVACLSTNSSFVYVLTGWSADSIQSLEPSCGYLAMSPLSVEVLNASYADVVKLMRGGFALRFPYTIHYFSYYKFKDCVAQSFLEIIRDKRSKISFGIYDTVMLDYQFWSCVLYNPRARLPIAAQLFMEATPMAMWILKWIAGTEPFILKVQTILITAIISYGCILAYVDLKFIATNKAPGDLLSSSTNLVN